MGKYIKYSSIFLLGLSVVGCGLRKAQGSRAQGRALKALPPKYLSSGDTVRFVAMSVARKIALFQESAGTRLRRKDAIKRKQVKQGQGQGQGSPPSLSSSNNSDGLSSPASSSDSYSYSDGGQGEGEVGSGLYRIQDRVSGMSLNLNNKGRRGSRGLKDCYQSFSLPLVPGSQILQLVEFTDVGLEDSEDELDHDLDHDPEEEPFYEELDLYAKDPPTSTPTTTMTMGMGSQQDSKNGKKAQFPLLHS
jgi:hypothetical protein